MNKPDKKSAKKKIDRDKIKFVKNHLNYLIKFNENHQYKGRNTMNWAKIVLPNVKIDDNLNKCLTRDELMIFCKNKDENGLVMLIAILSWGGMSLKHGKNLLRNNNSKDAILELVSNLRNCNYSNRQEAFQEFQDYRSKKLLTGMGIAFYTKLICFLAPSLNGYILDQWVGKSINLITGEKLIKINRYGWVLDINDSMIYERYCYIIDKLAKQFKYSGLQIEEKLFSIGYGKGKWRNYLKKYYKN